MMSLTRQHLKRLGARLTNRGVRILEPDEFTPEDIRLSILVKVLKAGWTTTPRIVCVDSDKEIYATEPLPVVGDCCVQLVFYDEDDWRIGSYQVSGTNTYIVEVTGKDGKLYPQALKDLRNPTREQINRMLTDAGLTDGQLLLQELTT